MEEELPENEEFKFQPVGELLQAERESQKLSITDVANKTRIPMRHLEAIEASNFTALPGTTYTLGFARNYARFLGLDAVKLAADLRAEMESAGHAAYQPPAQSYEPTDPARVPPRAFAWTAAAIAVLLVVGYLAWRNFALGDFTSQTPVAATQKAPAGKAAPAAAPVDPNGQVVLTARGDVWLRVYDTDNKRLFEKIMTSGETYTIPADAKGPMVNIGSPDLVDVTIGGKAVAPLGKAGVAIKDIGVSAAALLARPPEPAGDEAEERPSALRPATPPAAN